MPSDDLKSEADLRVFEWFHIQLHQEIEYFRKLSSDETFYFDVLNILLETVNRMCSLVGYMLKYTQTKNPTVIGKPYKKLIEAIDYMRAGMEMLCTLLEIKDYSPVLFIEGAAGVGKSHLLADIATKRIKEGKSTLLFLGQDFVAGRDPWDQILSSLKFDGSSEKFLELLNRKAVPGKERILILIDAINEGEGIKLWPGYFNSFIARIERFPYLAVAITYRSTYAPLLFQGNDLLNQYKKIIHQGFAGFEYKAFNAFAEYYGVKGAKIPILNKEFANPLFLKLFCIGLTNKDFIDKQERIGIHDAFDSFIQYVNRRLAHKDEYDYVWYKLNLVNLVVNEVARYMLKNVGNPDGLSYMDAFLLTEKTVNPFLNKRKFLDSLINEDIFIDEIPYSVSWQKEPIYNVIFSYQRLGDYLKARILLHDNIKVNLSEIKSGWLNSSNRQLFEYLEDQGLVDALTLYAAEYVNRELSDLLPSTYKYEAKIVRGFLNSLVWRKRPVSIDLLDEYWTQFLKEDLQYLHLFFDTTIELSHDTSNTLNGNYLHGKLMALSMSQRDAYWTIYLHDQYSSKNKKHTPVHRLLQWAWKIKDYSQYDNDAVYLVALTMTWFLTSNNRMLRDDATKALINLLWHRSNIILLWLKEFEHVNDPYVLQRVYAVTFGCIVRLRDKGQIKAIADSVYSTFFATNEVYPDILTRDYARQVIEFAIVEEVDSEYDTDRIRPPYKSDLPNEYPNSDDINRYYVASSANADAVKAILDSMKHYSRGDSSYGDFGEYIFGSAMSAWHFINVKGMSNLGIKWIFEKYGYNQEIHGQYDVEILNNKAAGRDIERIGKKYQWIVFFELLARVADNEIFGPFRYGDFKSGSYQGPWDPYVRDIDPTFLINPNSDQLPYWIPAIDFSHWHDISNKKWVTDDKDIPAPSSYLSVVDDSGRDWIVLHIFPKWDGNLKDDDSFENCKHFMYVIRSYIVNRYEKCDISALLDQLTDDQELRTECKHSSQIYNREFFWADSAKKIVDNWEEIVFNQKMLGKAGVTTVAYSSDNEYDRSFDREKGCFKPSFLLYVILGLKEGDNDGEYVNSEGKMVCFDPSIKYNTSPCLLIDKMLLLEKLNEHNLDIIWTAYGEKRIIGDDRDYLNIYSWTEWKDQFIDHIRTKLPPYYKPPYYNIED